MCLFIMIVMRMKHECNIIICLYCMDRVDTLVYAQYEKARYWLFLQEQVKKPIAQITYEEQAWWFVNNEDYYLHKQYKKERLESEKVVYIHGRKQLRLILFSMAVMRHAVAYQLCTKPITIGRNSSCMIQYQKSFVSAHHALLYKENEDWFIKDQHSSNGVYVNHQKVNQVKLCKFDCIHMMSFVIVFMDDFIVIEKDASVVVNELNELLPQVHAYEKTQIEPRISLQYEDACLTKMHIEKPNALWNEKKQPVFLMIFQSVGMQAPTFMMFVMMLLQKQATTMQFGMLLSLILMICMPLCMQFVDRMYKKKEVKKYLRTYHAYLEQKEHLIKAQVQLYQKQLMDKKRCFLFEHHEHYISKKGLECYLGEEVIQLLYPFEQTREELCDEADMGMRAYLTFIEKQQYDIKMPYFLELEKIHSLYIKGSHAMKYALMLLIQILKMHDDSQLKVILVADETVLLKWDLRFLKHLFLQNHRLLFTSETVLSALQQSLAQIQKSSIRHVVMMCLSKHLVKVDTAMEILKKNPFLHMITLDEQYASIGDDVIVAEDKITYQKHELYFTYAKDASIQKQLQQWKLKHYENKEQQVLSFLDLYECANLAQLNMAKRWLHHSKDQSLSVCIGKDVLDHVIYLDAHESKHGPHGLIAGMTGSGKSEFILAYILSLCLNYSCEEVAFVLIDYKGGMMATALAQLPHVAYVQTNLDKSGMYRFIASIHAELKMRQELFHKVKHRLHLPLMDIDLYQSLYREHQIEKPLTHLFIIADEFAELKDEQPEIIEQLNKTARIGRSLGIHLILATQKPYGVIDDQIWSNARFHVCLKVQTRSDSIDMLKKDDASYLQHPGEFYLQVGNDEVYIRGLGCYTQQDYVPQREYHKQMEQRIIQYDAQLCAQIKKACKKKETRRSQLALLSEYIQKQSAYLNVTKPFFMHPVLKLRKVKQSTSDQLIIGVIDDVNKQRQYPFEITLFDEERIMIIGKKASGKASMLRQLIYECTRVYKQEVACYIFDGEGHHFDALYPLDVISDIVEKEDDERLYSFHYQLLHLADEDDLKRMIIIHDYAQWSMQYDDFNEMVQEWIKVSMHHSIAFIISVQSINDVTYQIANQFQKRYTMQVSDISEYHVLYPNVTLYPMPQSGSGIMQLKNEVFLFQIDEYEEDAIHCLSRNHTKQHRIPVLPTTFYYHGNEKQIYLGKEIISKEDFFLPFEKGGILFIIQAFKISRTFYEKMKKLHVRIHENIMEAPQQDRMNIYFLTLATLQNYPYVDWYLESIYKAHIVWIGMGLVDGMNILKLPMECLQKPLKEDEALWYQGGEMKWIKLWREKQDG